MQIPRLGDSLSPDHLAFLEAFSKSCRRSIVEMTKNSQSGHPGGSLSSIDYLSVLYAFLLGQTGEKIVVSNGHISPAVYSVLGEMGYIPREEAIATFRKIGSIYEGHVTRHVKGVWYGTGPLGVGVSAATGFALAEQLRGSDAFTYALIGDGEAQEGQVYEMMHFARKYAMEKLIVFVDYNKVQLSDSLEEIMPLDLQRTFEAAGWRVVSFDAHDFSAIWNALSEAHHGTGQPVLLLGNSIMGKGVELMEPQGRAHKATWHGVAPKPDEADAAMIQLALTPEEQTQLETFRSQPRWTPEEPHFEASLTHLPVQTGTPRVYEAGKPVDCRSAYGNALVDLVKLNPTIVAATADLRESVKTAGVAEVDPKRHIECGIAEQQMVSMAGGLSLNGFIPFVSTFGAFMTSRAKDQARVNDINLTNVKMVATHCGLSVGEDGPTHQAIDDMGSMLGFFHTMVMEPVDANHTDRLIRYAASHYGNFYIRMGRHKFNVVTTEDGAVFYDENYVYTYGKCDLIREGSAITIAASGAMVSEALAARDALKKTHPDHSIEIIAVSSIKQFDDTLLNSIRKTKKVITLEDHNTHSGLGGQLARTLAYEGIQVDAFRMIGVEEYQLSGQWHELYHAAGIDAEAVQRACAEILG